MGLKDALEKKYGEQQEGKDDGVVVPPSEAILPAGVRNQKYQQDWQRYFEAAGCDNAAAVSYVADLIVINETGISSRRLPRERFLSYARGINPNYGRMMEQAGLPEDVALGDMGVSAEHSEYLSEQIRNFVGTNFRLPGPHMLARWMADRGAAAYLSFLDAAEGKIDFPELTLKWDYSSNSVDATDWNVFQKFESYLFSPEGMNILGQIENSGIMLVDFRNIAGHISGIRTARDSSRTMRNRIYKFYALEAE